MFRSILRCRIALIVSLAFLIGIPAQSAGARALEKCQTRNLEHASSFTKKLKNCLRSGADQEIDACARAPRKRLRQKWLASVRKAAFVHVECSPGTDGVANPEPKDVANAVAAILEDAWQQVHGAALAEVAANIFGDPADRIAELSAAATARLQRRSLSCYALDDALEADACAADAESGFLDSWDRVVQKAADGGVDLNAVVVTPAAVLSAASSDAVDEILTGVQPDRIVDTDQGVDFRARFNGETGRKLFFRVSPDTLDNGANKFQVQTWRVASSDWGFGFGTGGRTSDQGAPLLVESGQDEFCMRLIAHVAGDKSDIRGQGLSGNIGPCVE